MEEYSLKIGKAVLWVTAYLGIMLFYTLVDVAVWRKVFPKGSHWLNLITMLLCIGVFICLLKRTGYRIQFLSNLSLTGIMAAVCCSVLFYLLLDCCLDPIFERIFPASEQDYQETIENLRKSPVTALLQAAVIAPFIEEILMRGFVLGGLKNTYGAAAALVISAALFALLHFNMVQTLSAFICGIILGILYLKTESLLCCMVAHCGYNLLSYFLVIFLDGYCSGNCC